MTSRIGLPMLTVLSVLSVSSCQQLPPHLEVRVSNIPPVARSLEVIGMHAGLTTAVGLKPLNLAEPPPISATFLALLPGDFSGDLQVSVAAFSQPDATGCLVSTGSSEQLEFQGSGTALTLSLTPENDTACTGKKPVLLSATPSLGTTGGGEMIKLTGWGFKSDGVVSMGSRDAAFAFISAAQVTVTTPASAGFGPTSIRFANRDGSFDTRDDLFRFYADTLSFTSIPRQNTVPFLDTAGLAAAVFDPATTVDLAMALPGSPGRVRIEYTLRGTVLSSRQRNYTVGNNPGPIVVADFDRDGDLDLIVANIDDGTAQLLKNDGAGEFTVGVPFSVGSLVDEPVAMAQGDLNGDMAPDLVVANKRTGVTLGRLRVFTNMGDGTMMEIPNSPLNALAEPVSVALGDAKDKDKFCLHTPPKGCSDLTEMETEHAFAHRSPSSHSDSYFLRSRLG